MGIEKQQNNVQNRVDVSSSFIRFGFVAFAAGGGSSGPTTATNLVKATLSW